MVAFKGTSNLHEVAVDATQIALPLAELVGSLSKNLYFGQMKRAVDAVLKAYPRAAWAYHFVGHSLGGFVVLYMNRWLQLEHLQKFGTKYEDGTGKVRYRSSKSRPYQNVQMTTFNSGAGSEALVQRIRSALKTLFGAYKVPAKSSSAIYLRQYRIRGDPISVLESPYPTNHSYQKVFTRSCTARDPHTMSNFVSEEFLRPGDKCSQPRDPHTPAVPGDF